MNLKKLHHIALAVHNIDEALGDYADVLGLPRTDVVYVESQQVKATLIPVGDAEIELIEPTDPEGGVAKFLERRGEALHHVCFEVHDVDAELADPRQQGRPAHRQDLAARARRHGRLPAPPRPRGAC